MKHHILHSYLTSDIQAAFAKKFSDLYGQGAEDCAICTSAVSFTSSQQFHVLAHSFFKTGRGDFLARETLYCDCPPVDEKLLDGLSEYTMQTMQMLGRYPEIPEAFEERYQRYLQYVRFWNDYVLKNNITMIIFYSAPHEIFDFILYQLCEYYHLVRVVLVPFSLFIGRGYCVPDLRDIYTPLLNRYNELTQLYIGKDIDSITLSSAMNDEYIKMSSPERNKTPYYMNNIELSRAELSGKLGKAATKSLLKEHYRSFVLNGWKRYTAKELLKKLSSAPQVLCDYFREFKSDDTEISLLTKQLDEHYHALSEPADFSRPYVYFPLHLQPECTSNPLGGGMYVEQTIPIKILSACLPDDMMIYVKENPKQIFGARKPEYYDLLKTIPKVTLVPRDTDTYELIKHCWAVSSLTGTAGWEGLFWGKPYLMFGYYFLQLAPGVYHVRTVEDCKRAIAAIQSGENPITLRSLKLFMKACDEILPYTLYNETTFDIDAEKAVDTTFTAVANLLQQKYPDWNKLSEG